MDFLEWLLKVGVVYLLTLLGGMALIAFAISRWTAAMQSAMSAFLG